MITGAAVIEIHVNTVVEAAECARLLAASGISACIRVGRGADSQDGASGTKCGQEPLQAQRWLQAQAPAWGRHWLAPSTEEAQRCHSALAEDWGQHGELADQQSVAWANGGSQSKPPAGAVSAETQPTTSAESGGYSPSMAKGRGR